MAKTVVVERNEKKESDDWQRFLLREELMKAGITQVIEDDVEDLFRAGRNWSDVKRLSENECPPDLIYKILK